MFRLPSRQLSRSLSRTAYGGKYSGAVADEGFDPYTLITGTPDKGDTFTTLADTAAVHGRTLPTGGGTWAADAGWVGKGGGLVGSATAGQTSKGASSYYNCSVKMIWHPGATGNNQLNLFCRDIQTTPTNRYGYLLSTYPAHTLAPPAQAIALYRTDNFAFTNLSGFIAATIHRDWNVLELQCHEAFISGWLNGVKLIEVEDATYGGITTRWGFGQTNITNGDARVDYVDFTIIPEFG